MKKTYFWLYTGYQNSQEKPIDILEVENNTLRLHQSYDCETIDITDRTPLIDIILRDSLIYGEYEDKGKEFYRKHSKIRETSMEVGAHYPRVFRPIFSYEKFGVELSSDSGELAKRVARIEGKIGLLETGVIGRFTDFAISSSDQINYLVERLISVFRVVHPSSDNLASFGNEIRNIILLSCMEVELHFRGILEANAYSKGRGFLKTNDFVKLKSILRLDEYSLKLQDYPNIRDIAPFRDWSEEGPTKSLSWYDDYNKIKHDRNSSFHKASLINAINALAACFILLRAQFGELGYFNSQMGNFFQFERTPTWKYTEKYIPPPGNMGWSEIELEL